MDELWSFVDDRGNEQWVGLALDVATREIVGCHLGGRSGDSAKALWRSLPAVYRQCAVFSSDFWVSYPVAFPSNRHRAVGKAKQRGLGRGFQAPEINSGDSPSAFPHERLFQEETGITSYIERFNGTLRSRGSRLVRKTLSFSKKLENHISTIWYFINHYNSSLPMHSSFPV